MEINKAQQSWDKEKLFTQNASARELATIPGAQQGPGPGQAFSRQKDVDPAGKPDGGSHLGGRCLRRVAGKSIWLCLLSAADDMARNGEAHGP